MKTAPTATSSSTAPLPSPTPPRRRAVVLRALPVPAAKRIHAHPRTMVVRDALTCYTLFKPWTGNRSCSLSCSSHSWLRLHRRMLRGQAVLPQARTSFSSTKTVPWLERFRLRLRTSLHGSRLQIIAPPSA